MSTRVDQATFQKLLDSHRADPGNHSAAARAAAVTRRTSRHAWEVGYPRTPWGAKPISALITEEQEIARTRMEMESEAAELAKDQDALAAERKAEAARQNAIRAKEMEAAMINGLRGVTSQALAACIKAVPGIQASMQRLGEELTKMAESPGPLTHKEVVSLGATMRRYSSTLRELAQAGQTAMEMERLYLGEPSKVVGVVTEYDSMPLDELVRAANLQEGVLRRAADRGLVVADGVLARTVGTTTN